MRKLIKSILSKDEIENLKIRSRGDNRCESAKCNLRSEIRVSLPSIPSTTALNWIIRTETSLDRFRVRSAGLEILQSRPFQQ